jgi:hypothetical protein
MKVLTYLVLIEACSHRPLSRERQTLPNPSAFRSCNRVRAKSGTLGGET